MKKKILILICLMASASFFFSACAGMTPAQKGAVGGAAVGAVAGQLIGSDTKSTLIGAGAGALGGALLNDALRKNEPGPQKPNM
ncbi:MAG: glycine zipper 2TM domain-containing protein [Deltaproteobacteria bacterium]|nr:glycine zipper 2TM domain-containing protein [Deltaproteobacteria bacterium]